MLKDKLCETSILSYPNSSKPYTLLTDASKHWWAGVLTQEFETEVKGKVLKELHPVTYVSGLFCGSQLNWAAFTKEVYAVYLSVKKLAFYITDADITLRSDHLPLKRFLLKNTLNDKVNNWAVELEMYRKLTHCSMSYVLLLSRPILSRPFVKYRVPEFPHFSATFNIIVGSCIQALSQSSYEDHWVMVHVLHSAANHNQCQPIGTSQV